MAQKVSIIYNSPYFGKYSETGERGAVIGVLDSVNEVRKVLLDTGYNVDIVALEPPLGEAEKKIHSMKTDIVFNLFEGFDDIAQSEAFISGILQEKGFLFTGCSHNTIHQCSNKALTKAVLEKNDIPTPLWQAFSSSEENSIDSLWSRYPCIVKPSLTHASHGISNNSVIDNSVMLQLKIRELLKNYDGRCIVEDYVDGREFNVLVMSPPLVIFPVEEIVFEDNEKYSILTYKSKWDPEDIAYKTSRPECPAAISAEIESRIAKLASNSFFSFASSGYIRIDFRMDRQGNIMVIDVNPNPDIGHESGAWLQAKTIGWTYKDFINKIIKSAMISREKNFLKCCCSC